MLLQQVEAQRRVSRVLANVLLLALAIYSGIVLAKITWLIAWNDKPVPVAPASTSGGTAMAGQTYPMASYELFGRPVEQVGVADVVKRSAPETGLRLRLEGVLVGQRPEDSGAIVADSSGETAYYRVGEMLPGNAELSEVESSRILIHRGGRYESLTFEEADSGMLVTEATAEQPTELSPEAFVNQARAQLDNQGVAALNPYGLRPVDDSGQGGYVYSGTNAMLNAVGLKAGDVITAINGQQLGDIEQDKSLLENWRGQAQLDIEIERGGAILTVSYAIPEQWR
jgi:general secretion pathway protein C